MATAAANSHPAIRCTDCKLALPDSQFLTVKVSDTKGRTEKCISCRKRRSLRDDITKQKQATNVKVDADLSDKLKIEIMTKHTQTLGEYRAKASKLAMNLTQEALMDMLHAIRNHPDLSGVSVMMPTWAVPASNSNDRNLASHSKSTENEKSCEKDANSGVDLSGSKSATKHQKASAPFGSMTQTGVFRPTQTSVPTALANRRAPERFQPTGQTSHAKRQKNGRSITRTSQPRSLAKARSPAPPQRRTSGRIRAKVATRSQKITDSASNNVQSSANFPAILDVLKTVPTDY